MDRFGDCGCTGMLFIQFMETWNTLLLKFVFYHFFLTSQLSSNLTMQNVIFNSYPNSALAGVSWTGPPLKLIVVSDDLFLMSGNVTTNWLKTFIFLNLTNHLNLAFWISFQGTCHLNLALKFIYSLKSSLNLSFN